MPLYTRYAGKQKPNLFYSLARWSEQRTEPPPERAEQQRANGQALNRLDRAAGDPTLQIAGERRGDDGGELPHHIAAGELRQWSAQRVFHRHGSSGGAVIQRAQADHGASAQSRAAPTITAVAGDFRTMGV